MDVYPSEPPATAPTSLLYVCFIWVTRTRSICIPYSIGWLQPLVTDCIDLLLVELANGFAAETAVVIFIFD